MRKPIKAVFQNGVFVPEVSPDLREGTVVELEVHPIVIPPAVTDPEERARILKEVVESMRNNPIPLDSPRLTREQMHERR